MKRIHWWSLFGFAGAGLAAFLVGQTVWGQPDEKWTGGNLPPPIINTQPEFPASGAKHGEPEQKGISLPGGFSNPGQSLPGQGGTIGTPGFMPKDTVVPGTGELRPGKQQPSVSLEWTGPQSIRLNQPMACQLLVRNTSSGPVHHVVVRQRLPQGVTCKQSEPNAITEAGELVWNLGTLAPDQTRRIDVSLVCQGRGTVTCQASVTFTGAASHVVQVREPQLAVKMKAPDKVLTGESVTLLFAILNPGDGTAENVKVKAMLPEGLEHSRGRIVDVDVGNLEPGKSRTMQLVCMAKGTGIQKCMVVATAEGGITSNDSAQLDILMPKLDVTVLGPKMRYLDRQAVYVVKVTNPGNAPATNVEVHEVIPAGFKFNQANHGGQFHEATRTVTWTLGDLPPGQSREIAVQVIPIEAGEHRVVAHVKSSRGLKTEAEVRTVVEAVSSLVLELSDTDDPVEIGADTAYELRVANTGSKTETNVEVVCTLPEQVEFKGAKCSTTLRYRVEGRDLIFEPLPRLAPRADVVYRIQVRGTAAGDIRFRTRVKADGLREPITREETTRIYSDDAPTRPSTGPAPTPPGPTPTPPASTPGPAPLPIPNSTSSSSPSASWPNGPAAMPLGPTSPTSSTLMPTPPVVPARLPMDPLPLPGPGL